MATNSKGDNVTKSVSMPPALAAAAEARKDKLGIRNFSEYVRKLVEKDLIQRGSIIYEESGAPVSEPAPPKKPVEYKISRKPRKKVA